MSPEWRVQHESGDEFNNLNRSICMVGNRLGTNTVCGIPFKQYHAILSPGANKDFHINIEMAKYYGLNSIVAKKK